MELFRTCCRYIEVGHEKIRNFPIPLETQACLFSSDEHKEHARSVKVLLVE